MKQDIRNIAYNMEQQTKDAELRRKEEIAFSKLNRDIERTLENYQEAIVDDVGDIQKAKFEIYKQADDLAYKTAKDIKREKKRYLIENKQGLLYFPVDIFEYAYNYASSAFDSVYKRLEKKYKLIEEEQTQNIYNDIMKYFIEAFTSHKKNPNLVMQQIKTSRTQKQIFSWITEDYGDGVAFEDFIAQYNKALKQVKIIYSGDIEEQKANEKAYLKKQAKSWATILFWGNAFEKWTRPSKNKARGNR
jgi:hypothetical protein